MDGQAQRKALTAAEQALRALGRRDAEAAERAARRAHELDQTGVYAAFPTAVGAAAAEIRRGEAVSEATWDTLEQTLGPGPLAAVVVSLRS
jgi:hypothetical protein